MRGLKKGRRRGGGKSLRGKAIGNFYTGRKKKEKVEREKGK
jgi:hypothetical protein